MHWVFEIFMGVMYRLLRMGGRSLKPWFISVNHRSLFSNYWVASAKNIMGRCEMRNAGFIQISIRNVQWTVIWCQYILAHFIYSNTPQLAAGMVMKTDLTKEAYFS
jgi:hypothetical protein